MIDAGRFDTRTAYAAVNTLRVSDMRPHIYRTHDAGRTWKEIVAGMEDGGPVNAVREDPKRRGLLYASTEKGVYVSFDDGERWQSLRLNLPAELDSGSHRQGRRPCRRDARARVLDPRRHRTAASAAAVDSRRGRRALQARRRVARPLEPE